jgi:hypothetical protein
MTRTTVYLSQDAKRRLSLAARRHRSEAELIRDAIDRLLAEEPERPRPNPPVRRVKSDRALSGVRGDVRLFICPLPPESS